MREHSVGGGVFVGGRKKKGACSLLDREHALGDMLIREIPDLCEIWCKGVISPLFQLGWCHRHTPHA